MRWLIHQWKMRRSPSYRYMYWAAQGMKVAIAELDKQKGRPDA